MSNQDAIDKLRAENDKYVHGNQNLQRWLSRAEYKIQKLRDVREDLRLRLKLSQPRFSYRRLEKRNEELIDFLNELILAKDMLDFYVLQRRYESYLSEKK